MPYRITSYTREKASNLGVQVKPSTIKGKKIDVFKNGKKIASIGALGYADYPTFVRKKGIDYADKRRAAYKLRHEKDRHKPGTPGYYADKLLW
jgi:hypothetical protein